MIYSCKAAAPFFDIWGSWNESWYGFNVSPRKAVRAGGVLFDVDIDSPN